MREILQLTPPLDKNTILALHAGDRVLISGTIYTARDAAHLRLCQLIEQGRTLPIDLTGQLVYFVGPTPPQPGRPVGAAGPTTSSRMDQFSPLLYERGLAGTIGKGYRGTNVIDSLKNHQAAHFTALGGAGALLSKCIVKAKIVAYEDLGTEAIRELTVRDFPATVAYDAHGQTVYRQHDPAARPKS